MASLLCSIAICCPAMSLAGPLLGARALVEMRADPLVRGRGLALAGIWIGIATLVCWGLGAWWWHVNARLPMMHGPREALHGGLAGDLPAFKAAFERKGSDDEARAFLNEVQSRYGRFLESRQKQIAQAATQQSVQPSAFVIRYELEFDRESVEADAEFITFGPSGLIPDPVFKWGSIRIIDAQRGDLVYPVAEAKAHAATRP